jgi:hypothetical protein
MRLAPHRPMSGCSAPAGPGGRADLGNGLLIRFTQVRILPGAPVICLAAAEDHDEQEGAIARPAGMTGFNLVESPEVSSQERLP